MVPVQKLIDVFQTMYQEHWKYSWSGHTKGNVGCAGAFTYAFALYGINYPNGANAIERNKLSGKLLPISEAKPGMAAFKVRTPDEAKYNLPEKYRVGGSAYNGDLNDYYHIGLVDTDGKHVLNAKGEKYGFCRDGLTKSAGWDYVAYLRNVDYNGDEMPMQVTYQAKVVGGNLNLRSRPDTASERVAQIPDGSIVTVTEDLAGWSKVSWNGKTGYVKSEYLEEVQADDDVVTVSRPELQKMYDTLGDWLGLRG